MMRVKDIEKKRILGNFLVFLYVEHNLFDMADTTNPIDSYIEQFPEETREKLESIRQIIRKAAPAATETISYGIPTFKLKTNLVHFAGYKKHIGFYPTPSGIEAFKQELSEYEVSKGTVKFPLDKPMPYDLIRKIVEFRVNESQKEE
jgi:uncharacterized protein YdhG (YjbR/CyaY superfamily)